MDKRHKNVDWGVGDDTGKVPTWERVAIAVLMDIRDELQVIRTGVAPLRHLECSRFLSIPLKLDEIVKNTKRKARKRRVK